MRQLFYYKMRQKFITKCVRFFITKCHSFITKCDSYYKMQRLLQIATYFTIPSFITELQSLLNNHFHPKYLPINRFQNLSSFQGL